MAVPDLRHIVQGVRDAQAWPFRLPADLCAYSHACLAALHEANALFGKLSKSSGQHHCIDPGNGLRGAVDVALYKPTGQIVDFIASAGYEPDVSKPEPENAVTWIVGPLQEYTAADWFAPSAAEGGDGGDGDGDTSGLEARVAALESIVTTHTMQIERNRVRMEAINDRVDYESDHVNVHQPLPEYVGRVGPFTITSRPKA